ncbi:MAG: hypothetical protein K6E62_11560 [Lachnospiraceae bacterium]|nr:hypothetical protein [Lachnospiraceae bacterium]
MGNMIKKIVGLVVFLMAFGMMPGLTMIARAENGTISGTGTSEDPYKIDDVDDWNTFAKNVTDGTTDYNGKTVVLAADIGTKDDPVTTMVGDTSSHCFKGTFDGQGHSMTFMLSGGGNIAPFPKVDGATFKNLRVEGTMTGTGAHASGLVSHIANTVSFTNVVIWADISASRCGGFVGHGETGSVSFEN